MSEEQLPISKHKLHGWTHFVGLYVGEHVAATKLYNWANVIIFTVISAAMITVSSTAVRFLFHIPAQLQWYPTNMWFVLIVLAFVLYVFYVSNLGNDYVVRIISIRTT
jgi:hypothetical protein